MNYNIQKMDLLEALCFETSLKIRAATISHLYEVASTGMVGFDTYREKARLNREEAIASIKVLQEALNQ